MQITIMLKQLDIQVNEPTNQNSIKVVEPTNNTTKDFKKTLL